MHRTKSFNILALCALLTLAMLLSGCGQKPTATDEETGSQTETGGNAETGGHTETDDISDSDGNEADIDEEPAYDPTTAYSNDTNPIVTIEMDNGDLIVVELYPEVAPNTVNNFISLANSGYYDGVIFHRVIKGFMIQGGDPLGNGTGGPGYSIKAEFTNSGHVNDLSHDRGVISMARQGAQGAQDALFYDTAGSQFFIMHEDSPFLDHNYTSFGKVIEGIEAVDDIATTATDRQDKPTTDQVMAKVRVDTKGVTYDEPETIGK